MEQSATPYSPAITYRFGGDVAVTERLSHCDEGSVHDRPLDLVAVDPFTAGQSQLSRREKGRVQDLVALAVDRGLLLTSLC
jgi:hypothetical protein